MELSAKVPRTAEEQCRLAILAQPKVNKWCEHMMQDILVENPKEADEILIMRRVEQF